MADDLPFAVGDFVVQDADLSMISGVLVPDPLPEAERACFVVEEIDATLLRLRLISGLMATQSPGAEPLPEAFPRYHPEDTITGTQSTEPLFEPCLPKDPTGIRTVSRTCDIARLYRTVADCNGRPPAPPLN